MTSLMHGGACALAAVIWPAAALAWPAATLVPPEGLSAELFPRPERLDGAIEFWSAVFARHSSSRVVIHDRDDMSVIWQVLELPVGEEGAVDEEAASELVRGAVEELRGRLKRLASRRVGVDEEDQVLLALVGGADSPRLQGAHDRLRTQRGVADHFRLGLERARQWLPTMRDILVSEGVPPELAALPFIESTFNPLARSSAGAAGLWQLMPGTARQFGLTVGRGNDERLDVVKATRVAARILKQNYEMLGSWPLAITGYNHGPYGLRRAVREAGSTDLVYLIDNHKKTTWGFASKNFYAEFLAALRLVQQSGASEAATASVNDAPSLPDGSLR